MKGRPVAQLARAAAWAGAALLLALPAGAQPPAPPPPPASPWEVTAILYGWGVAIDGEVSADRVSTDFDVSFSDILDDLNLGAMGALEVRRDRFVFLVDGMWAQLEDDVSAGPLDLDGKLDQVTIDAKAGWRVLERPLAELAGGTASGDDSRKLAVDLLAGLRYWYFKTELDLRIPPIGVDRDIDDSTDWVDPILGVRTRVDLTERLSLGVLGDLGGFGIGSASSFTWQGVGLFSWELSEAWRLGLGYKAVSIDRDEVDAVFHGPVLAAAYRF